MNVEPDRLRQLASKGLTVSEAARRFGMSRRTLFRRFDQDPALREAWEAGRSEWAEAREEPEPEPPCVAESLTRGRRLSEAELAIVAAAAAKGATETAISEALGVHPRSFRRMKQRDERLTEALELARLVEHDVLVNRLWTAAMGDGRDSTIAAMFLLKSRHGYRDRGDIDTGSESRVRVEISLPAALSSEQYTELVERQKALGPIDVESKEVPS